VTTLLLSEYQTRPGVPLTPRQAELLRGRFGCHVTLADTSGERYDIRPRELVGALTDGDITRQSPMLDVVPAMKMVLPLISSAGAVQCPVE
jgi:hypothetical protein